MSSRRDGVTRTRGKRVTSALRAIVSFVTVVHCLGAPVDKQKVTAMASGWLAEGGNRLSEQLAPDIRGIENHVRTTLYSSHPRAISSPQRMM